MPRPERLGSYIILWEAWMKNRVIRNPKIQPRRQHSEPGHANTDLHLSIRMMIINILATNHKGYMNIIQLTFMNLEPKFNLFLIHHILGINILF